MGSMLRNIILAPALVAAAAFAANTASAETRLKVPFSFNVNGKECPAGVYTVERDHLANLVTLKSQDAMQSFHWVLTPGEPEPNASAVVLKFDEVGETHTLRSVQYGALVTARLDKKPKASEHAHTRTVPGE
jgi:hypothetical protein